MMSSRWYRLAILLCVAVLGVSPLIGCDDGGDGDGDGDADADTDVDADSDSDGDTEAACRDAVQAALDCLHDYCQGRGEGTYYCDICEPRGYPNGSTCGCGSVPTQDMLQERCSTFGPERFEAEFSCTTMMNGADMVDDRCFGANSCPINSGYPCACTNVNGPCGDGGLCVSYSEGATAGFCSAPCASAGYGGDCSTHWGVQYLVDESVHGGLCAIPTVDIDVADHCLVVCEDTSGSTPLSGPCPPGLACATLPGNSLSHCQ